ncbi:MAG: hypothetical protein GTO45_27835 [Candidatus Aminicenantes bacterium]|nr:hypothetical protein [Candidatus Aminicenantes bacterium]NIM82613.1 hypothetical protein [Candidatus Aminicenantes bacterium]NIN21981.1 hypothetical protein [Candidatus Aminicenantes bacterium]NIN45743.1 hypothetical protein [Candidatus Aminicenantes bacterium]NIN88581.1 hypothetical protein [Candidatus Aminicenantes bacterium]
MKFKTIVSMALCVVCVTCLMVSGCKKSSEVQADPIGALLQYNGCKQFLANTQENGLVPGPHNDCIEYQYNGSGKLILRHINAGFNCCPGEITATIEFNGNLVIITEAEAEQACRCNCLFDLDFEINNLSPGQYTIRIIEPYVETGDQVLEITVNLSSATSGSFCLPRNYYPWVQ